MIFFTYIFFLWTSLDLRYKNIRVEDLELKIKPQKLYIFLPAITKLFYPAMFIFPSSESDENLYFILTLRDIFPDKNKQQQKKKIAEEIYNTFSFESHV